MYYLYCADVKKHQIDSFSVCYLRDFESLSDAYLFCTNSIDGLPLWIWEDVLGMTSWGYVRYFEYYREHADEFFERVRTQALQQNLPFVYCRLSHDVLEVLDQINDKLCNEWNGHIEAV